MTFGAGCCRYRLNNRIERLLVLPGHPNMRLGKFFGREISRDVIGHLRSLGYIAAGPRSPQPGAP